MEINCATAVFQTHEQLSRNLFRRFRPSGFETETGELPSAQEFAEEVWDRQGVIKSDWKQEWLQCQVSVCFFQDQPGQCR